MFHLIGLQSEEDLALKQQLELYVERAQDSEEGIQRTALEAMRYRLRFRVFCVVNFVVSHLYVVPSFSSLISFREALYGLTSRHLRIILSLKIIWLYMMKIRGVVGRIVV